VPKILPRLYRKLSRKKCLEKRANTLKNAPKFFYGTALDFCAGLYKLFSPRKVCPAPSSISVPIKCCTIALKSMPILSKNSCCRPRFLCTFIVVRPSKIRTVRRVLPCYLLPRNPCCYLPWDACSPSANAISLLKLDLSLFSLLLSQQEKWMNNPQWVCPLALIDLMREGEGFSNLMVEIRLDEWLRLGVASLTLTLVMKLSFNLHLTVTPHIV
jgi:hypothetical protein